MKVTPCRSKVYDIDEADVVRIELMTGQVIEVPFENHKSWEIPFAGVSEANRQNCSTH